MIINAAVKARFCTTVLLGTVVVGTYAVPVGAQDAEPAVRSLEEIVVTARRREESLQSVPVAITAFTSDDLERKSIETVEDLRFAAPSLQIAPSSFGPSVPSFTIRGQRLGTAIASQDGPVALYFADQPQARVHGSNGVLYDLQSVQVLKGPQGTLFGRNTTGGAILINPNKPSLERDLQGEVTGELGDYNLYGATAVLNAGVSDRLALRFAGQLKRRDGYTESLFDGREFDNQDSEAWRVGILWQPTDDLQNYTVYQHYKHNNDANAWRLIAVNPASRGLAPMRPAVIPAMQTQLAALNADDFHTAATDQRGFDDLDTWTISNTTNWTFGGVTLKNILGYRSVQSGNTFDYDGTTARWNAFLVGSTVVPAADSFGVFNSVEYLDAEQWTNEFQVLGTALDDRLNWITGLYYFTEDAHDYQLSDLVGRRTNDGIAQNDSYSVFAQATYELGSIKGLSATAGARYTWDERELEQLNRIQSFSQPALGCRLTQAGPTGAQVPLDPCSRTNEYSDSAPTWTVSVDYQINDQVMVYLAHQRGYRSGGLQLYTNRSDETQTFDPEFVKNYELGLKSTFEFGNAALRFNAAVYRQDYSDIQRIMSFADPRINGALTTLVLNAAEATIDGGEAELTFIPISSLEISGFVGLVDASYDRFVNDRVSPPVVLTNNEFAGVPDTTAGVTARVRMPFGANVGDVWLQGSWYKQTDMEMADVNDVSGFGVLEGYDLFNAAITWQNVMGNQNIDAQLTVRNLTDEEYYTHKLTIYDSTGLVSGLLGAPRTVVGQVTFRFGQ